MDRKFQLLRHQLVEALEHVISSLWQETTGVKPEKVWALIGASQITVWIRNAGSPADSVVKSVGDRSCCHAQDFPPNLSHLQLEISALVENAVGRVLIPRFVWTAPDTGDYLFSFLRGFPPPPYEIVHATLFYANRHSRQYAEH